MSTTENQPSVLELLAGFGKSSIGAKVIMASTGVVVWGFVIGHMVGNLQIFLPGAYVGEILNNYAHTLKTTPPLLWGTRIVVGVSLVVHIATGIRLAAMNRMARPKGYRLTAQKKAGIASKLMPYTGLVVMAFIILHLFHFTIPYGPWSEFHTFTDPKGQHDVYRMVVEGFSSASMWSFYVFAQLLLFAHLWHGRVSFMQSLGLRHARWTPFASLVARTIVGLILGANVFMPSYVFFTYGLS